MKWIKELIYYVTYVISIVFVYRYFIQKGDQLVKPYMIESNGSAILLMLFAFTIYLLVMTYVCIYILTLLDQLAKWVGHIKVNHLKRVTLPQPIVFLKQFIFKPVGYKQNVLTRFCIMRC